MDVWCQFESLKGYVANGGSVLLLLEAGGEERLGKKQPLTTIHTAVTIKGASAVGSQAGGGRKEGP